MPLFWFLTDEKRFPNPEIILSNFPKGLKIGVILRHYNIKKRYDLAKRLLKICKRKRFVFLVGGDSNIAKSIGADGVHYPRWKNFHRNNLRGIISCSYHGFADYRRCKKLSANMVLISPIFTTKSNLNKLPLGITRSSMLLNSININGVALGGINVCNIQNFTNTGFSSFASVGSFIREDKY